LCCDLVVGPIPHFGTAIYTGEFDMKGLVPTGEITIAGAVPDGGIDGVAFGLYWRDLAGNRWRLQSRRLPNPGNAATPDFFGGWPIALSEAQWDALMPCLAGGTFNDFVARRQAQCTLGGAQLLGNGVWGIPTGRVPGDINGDGCVDQSDLGLLLQTWGSCCP
jgi:hypothetical protein